MNLQSEESEESSSKAIKRNNGTGSSPSPNHKKRKEGHNIPASPEEVGSAATTNIAQPLAFDTALELSPIEKIIRSGVWWGDNVITIVYALRKLLRVLCENSADRNAENCNEAAKAGIGPILVGVMRKWHNHQYVLSVACKVLVPLTSYNSLDFARTQGIIDTVVWALKQYPEPSDLQTHGFISVSNLCNKKKEDAIYIVQNLEFLSFVEQIFKQHQENPALVDRVTVLLKALAVYEELHEGIIDARGVPILAEALYFYKKHDTRVENKKGLAKAALKILCNSDVL